MALKDKIIILANKAYEERTDRLSIRHGEIVGINHENGTVDVECIDTSGRHKTYTGAHYPRAPHGMEVPIAPVGSYVSFIIIGGDEGTPVIVGGPYRNDYESHRIDTGDMKSIDRVAKAPLYRRA